MTLKSLFASAICFISLLSSASADILIGLQTPLTGPAATLGKSAKGAAEIAVDRINASGGLLGQKLVLQIYDDQIQGAQAISIANQVTSDRRLTAMIASSYSEPTRAAATIYQSAKMLYLAATASHPDITKAGTFVFRGSHLGESQGEQAATYMKKQGYKKVSIVKVDNDFGASVINGLKDRAKQIDLGIASEYAFSMSDRQFGTLVANIKRDAPDVVYICAFEFNGGPLVAQLRAGGFTGPLVACQSMGNQVFLQITGPASEGIAVIDTRAPDYPNPAFQDFFKELKARGAEASPDGASSTYAFFEILADAIKRTGTTDPERLRDAVAATKELPTIRGVLHGFTARREVLQEYPVLKAQNGKFTHIESLEP